jgi:hypothetical protein
MILAAIPGFFGLMGLGQLYEGKRTRGLAFLFAGIAVSFLSSWYIILPSRIDAFLFGGTLPSAYALSFLAPIFGTSQLAGRLSLDLLGVVMVLWGLQLFDAMGPIFARKQAAIATVAQTTNAPSWNSPAAAVASAPAKNMNDTGP